MPKSLIECIERKQIKHNATNWIYYKQLLKKYYNKLTTLKRDLERKYYSDQLGNNKTDIKNHGISWNR